MTLPGEVHSRTGSTALAALLGGKMKAVVLLVAKGQDPRGW